MQSEWQIETFSTAPIKIIDGDRGTNYPKQEEFSGQGFCLFLNAGNVTNDGFDFSDCMFIDQKKDEKLRKGKLVRFDTVLTTRGTVGNVAYYNTNVPFDHLRINSGMVILRPDERQLFSQYLSFFLRSNYFKKQVECLSTGSAQPQLPIRDINRIKIPIPPLPEQKAIAQVLASLDDKIELNRRMNATLEAMAQTLFRAWFVDFEPVKAKAAGLLPAGMDAATAALFSDSFEPSTLGMIPKGWEVKTVAEVFDVTMGQSPPGESYNQNGAGLVFYQGRADFGFRYPTPRIYCTAPTRYASKGSTLLSVRAPVGDINLAAEDCCIGRGVASLRYKRECLSFGYYTLQNMNARFHNFNSEGTVFGAINKMALQNLQVVAPPDGVLDAAESVLSALDKRIENNCEQSQTLSVLRDVLLPRLISGRLRVPEAMRAVEATR